MTDGVPTQAVSVWNMPNALTVTRLICVPVVAVLLLADDGTNQLFRDIAAVVFVLASVTDFIDGALARRRGQVTTLGRILDPIADKALIGVALIGLSILGDVPWWVTGVIVTREVLVTWVRFRIAPRTIPVSRGGKAKTLAQIIAIAMALVVLPGVPGWSTAAAVAMGIAVVLTVVTGVQYLAQARRA
jgi:CDP-diacylglycerol---glycerol-3-phosphate 3-phosphatidyltransferase